MYKFEAVIMLLRLGQFPLEVIYLLESFDKQQFSIDD